MSRPQNLLWNAIAEIEGAKIHSPTKSEAGRISVTLKELLAAFPGLTVEELHRRAANYRLWFPYARLTARALASHWSRCDQPPIIQAPPPSKPFKPIMR